MTLLEKIDQDIKQAMIAKDQARLDVLRFLKSALKYALLEKKGAPLADSDILQVIQRQIKQRRESIQQFVQGGRQDLANKEEKEASVLEGYLPKQMSDEELTAFIRAEVETSKMSGKKDFGRAMKLCVDKLAGAADNKRISAILGKILP
jgi:hypothetical protein